MNRSGAHCTFRKNACEPTGCDCTWNTSEETGGLVNWRTAFSATPCTPLILLALLAKSASLDVAIATPILSMRDTTTPPTFPTLTENPVGSELLVPRIT